MQQFKVENLFTIEEVAKFAGMSRDAAYMHYRRGHINAVPMLSHRLYFTRDEIDHFRAQYCPFNEQRI